ncbi:hypothetical protein BX600DRAFT_519154 [Xylariales sp. PMI_506]|nr:hypothetical protein BX600DRAFT_519154 [Xylariales sp. PMI_506]
MPAVLAVCDETKPSCQRCVRYGRACPGYGDQFIFRSQNEKVAWKASALVAASGSEQNAQTTNTTWVQEPSIAAPIDAAEGSSPDSSKTPVATSSITDASNGVDAGSGVSAEDGLLATIWRDDHAGSICHQDTPPAKPVEAYSDQVALYYFMNRFTAPATDDSFPSHLGFLQELYNDANRGCLELATLSVAHMASYNKWRNPKSLAASFEYYGSAVKALVELLFCEDTALDDSTFAAVLVLHLFMDISGERNELSNPHVSGLYLLLKRKGLHRLKTRRGGEMVVCALTRLYIHSFLMNHDVYMEDTEGYTQVMGESDHLWRAHTITNKIPGLRRTLKSLPATLTSFLDGASLPSTPASPGDDNNVGIARATLVSCLELLTEFDKWDQDAIPYWEAKFPHRTPPSAMGRIAKEIKYYDVGTACSVLLVRSSRMVMCLSILRYIDAMQAASAAASPAFTSTPSTGPIHTTTPPSSASTSPCSPLATIHYEDNNIINTIITPSEVSSVHQQIRSVVEDILALVPYALGDIDPFGNPQSNPRDGAGGLIILWPLLLVAHCPLATPVQIQHTRAILGRIGSSMGIRGVYRWLVDMDPSSFSTTSISPPSWPESAISQISRRKSSTTSM